MEPFHSVFRKGTTKMHPDLEEKLYLFAGTMQKISAWSKFCAAFLVCKWSVCHSEIQGLSPFSLLSRQDVHGQLGIPPAWHRRELRTGQMSSLGYPSNS